MPVVGNNYFPKVKAARKALQAKIDKIVDDHLDTIAKAVEAGEYESALKAQQWIIEHSADDDGTRVVDISVDKPKVVDRPTGPTLQIGFAIGGLQAPQEPLVLPKAIEAPSESDESIIEVDPLDPPADSLLDDSDDSTDQS